MALVDCIQYLLPNTSQIRAPKMIVYSFPWRKIFRQHAPLATTFCHVQNRIDDDQLAVLRLSTTFALWMKIRFYLLPFFLAQITRVQRLPLRFISKKLDSLKFYVSRQLLIAPFLFDGTCNTAVFNTWLEKELLPILSPGTLIILGCCGFVA